MTRQKHPKPELSAVEAELLSVAREARDHAYVPYSRFAVGAAIRTLAGQVFHGFNVENSAYPLTMCAERVALYTALVSGQREFTHIALIADQLEPLSPCGACRQVLAELAPKAHVLMANVDGLIHRTTTKELLPFPFNLPKEDKTG